MTPCAACIEGHCSVCDDIDCNCPHTPSSDPWRRWAGLSDGYPDLDPRA